MAAAASLVAVRSFRFLASRRWVVLALVVVLLGYLAWWLGEWQFHRLADRKERNAITERNEVADPVPVQDVLAAGRPVSETDEWRLVTASGEYDVAGTVVVRYQTRDGESGVDVVVPLVTEAGTVLVDRGWIASDDTTPTPDALPAPPAGTTSVVGWVRADATGDSTHVSEGSTRALSSVAIADYLDRELLGGFLDLKSEDPAPDEPLARAELPDLGNGPHFFYGLQWWFFGLLAGGGFIYLAWDEWRRPRSPGSDGDRRATASAASPRPPEP